MKKILCPIDFSNASLNAIEYATRIAEKHQGTLALLYVFTENDFNKVIENENLPLQFDDLIDEAKYRLRKLSEEIKAESLAKGLQDCYYYLKTGDLEDNIVNFAKEEKYSLIVMGTKGVSDVTEAFMGSNTVRVIESTTCPVLCVPEKATYSGFTKVVYATDYQDKDKDAIQLLLLLIQPFNPTIKMLHVGQSEKKVKVEHLQEYKDEMISYVNYNKLDFVYEVYDDEPNLAIDRYMIKEDCDLLVLLTHERNFFEKLFHDSLSKKMSYFSDYPLLIFTAKW
jgi:nucleotide-binding universal stress UspA family protein